MSGDWSYARIGDVLKTGAGGTPLKAKNEYYKDGDVPWLLSGEVAQGEITKSENFITRLGLENSSAKIFPPNTVLVAMYGATAGQVGVLRFAAATNQAVCGILPDARFDAKFVFYALLSKKAELIGKASGNAQPNISQIKIRDTLIPVLSLSEQRRIVVILDKAFEAIASAMANAEKNLANAREIFENFLQSVFSNKREHWAEVLVGKVADCSLGKMLDRSKNKGEPRPYLRNLNVRWFEFDLDDLAEMRFEKDEFSRYSIECGDAVICEGGYPGRSAVWAKDKSVYFQKALHRVRFANPLYAEWLVHYLHYLESNGSLEEFFTGTGIQHFTGQALKGLPMPFPPEDEIAALVAKFHSMKEASSSLENVQRKKLEYLDELKQALLREAFSGELGATRSMASPSFSANILAFAYERHRNENQEKTFGRVKAQKLLHLVEASAGVDLGRQPIKDAAGPNDFQHMLRAEDWAEKNEFFRFRRGDGRYHFERLSKYRECLLIAQKELSPVKSALNKIVDLLLPMDSETAEVMATVYAGWNNLILDGREASDEAIVRAAREEWHKDKLNISRGKFFDAIRVLRRASLIPDGNAKRVGQKGLL